MREYQEVRNFNASHPWPYGVWLITYVEIIPGVFRAVKWEPYNAT